MKQIQLDVLGIKGIYFPWRKAVDVVATTNTAITVGTIISGVTLTATTRVLLTAQTSGVNNGVYINGSRADDFTVEDPAASAIFYDLNTRTFWLCTNSATDIIGTAALSFTQFSLGNVAAISAPTTGQILTYNGTSWVNGGLAYGEIVQVTNYSLSMPNTNTWYALAPASTTLTGSLTSPAAGIIRSGSTDGNIKVEYYLSISIGSSNKNLEFSIFIGGTINSLSISRQRLIASTDIQSFSFSKIINVPADTNIQIFVRNTTSSGSTLTVRSFNLTAQYL